MRPVMVLLVVVVGAVALGGALYAFGPDMLRETPAPAGTGASALSADADEDVRFTVLAEGTNAAGVSERTNYAAYAEEEFGRLWRMAYGPDAPALPSVDFEREYVIGVFAGERVSGGYDIDITRITDGNAVRTVHIDLTSPGAGCIVTQALTSPFQIVTVPYSLRSLAKEYTEVEARCD